MKVGRGFWLQDTVEGESQLQIKANPFLSDEKAVRDTASLPIHKRMRVPVHLSKGCGENNCNSHLVDWRGLEVENLWAVEGFPRVGGSDSGSLNGVECGRWGHARRGGACV